MSAVSLPYTVQAYTIDDVIADGATFDGNVATGGAPATT